MMAVALGLDIGKETVKAAVLRSSGTTVTLDRYVCMAIDELREQGVDVEDAQALAQAVASRVLARRLRTAGAVVGISGRDTIIHYSFLAPMPEWRLRLHVEHKVKEFSEKSGDELTSDFIVVPVASSEPGFAVLVALAKDVAIEPLLGSLSDGQLDVAKGVPAAIALGDALRFLGDPEPDGYTVVVDIGRASTDVSVIEGNALVFARSLSTGGDLYNERLMKEFGVGAGDAEAFKHDRRGPAGESLGPVLRPVTQQLGNLVKSTLSYMKAHLKLEGAVRPAKLYVTGGAARLPGLASTLGAQLNCQAEVWDPLAGIETGAAPSADRGDVDERGLEAAVACGLALNQLLPTATAIDLLPANLRAARNWRQRTVWLVAAGVLLATQALLSLGLAYHRQSAESGRAARLKSRNQKRVKARERAHAKRIRANDDRERGLLKLAGSAKTGRHLQSVLEVLGRLTSRSMTLESLSVDAVADRRRDSSAEAAVRSFTIRGEIDNAQLRCEQEFADLQKRLSEEDFVGSVRVTPKNGEGTDKPRVKFEIKIEPRNGEV